MKRVLAMAIVLSFVSVSTAFAQERPVDFSARAAGIGLDVPEKTDASRIGKIERIEKIDTKDREAGAKQTQKKSFWRTPWPYVIVAAVVGGLLIANKKSEGGIY
jgi:ABC-type Fe3+-siderophore transport system permease subunit